MATVISNNITSPLGLTTEQTYKAVREGKSGLSHYPCENGEGGWNDLPFPIEASLFSKEQWDKIIECGQLFSAECCKDIYNYISPEFGSKMKF